MSSHARGAAGWVAGGAVCGLAWSSALRAYMAELAGVVSEVSWAGTFLAILLPGAVAGGLLGWAAHQRLTRADGPSRWLVAAPLVLAIAPMLLPGALLELFTNALGGGALAIAVMGLAGGYAIGGRGPRWSRVACGAAYLALLVGMPLSVPAVGGPGLALDQPRGAWVAVLGCSLMAVLALACAIPHRPAAR